MRKTTLRNIIVHLNKCYTGHLGVEFKYVGDKEKTDWLTKAVEKTMLEAVSLGQKKRILQKLNEGVMFEKFLHTKYIGQKRFSLEGGETTIAALDAIINTSAKNNVEEVVIGMAHRGRLNVLANSGLIKTVFDSLSLVVCILAALKLSPIVINILQEIIKTSPAVTFLLGVVITFIGVMALIRFIGRKTGRYVGGCKY